MSSCSRSVTERAPDGATRGPRYLVRDRKTSPLGSLSARVEHSLLLAAGGRRRVFAGLWMRMVRIDLSLCRGSGGFCRP
jgi:hypothetical protein